MIRDLGQLRAFLAIVQFGSVGRAAQTSHVTQSVAPPHLLSLNSISSNLFDEVSAARSLISFSTVFISIPSGVIGGGRRFAW